MCRETSGSFVWKATIGVAMGPLSPSTGFQVATFWAPVPERFEPAMKPTTVLEGRQAHRG